MSRQSFEKMEAAIYAEYRMKNYSVADALRIAQATSGEIANRKHAKAKINRRRVRRTTRIRH